MCPGVMVRDKHAHLPEGGFEGPPCCQAVCIKVEGEWGTGPFRLFLGLPHRHCPSHVWVSCED